MKHLIAGCLVLGFSVFAGPAFAEGDWETTTESEKALQRGLEWLARNQTPKGNWESNDLGLVSMGSLAFMAAGHTPGRGRYGRALQRSLDYVLSNAKPSGLLNIAGSRRDMYNHGLATFVLGQAHGMTDDPRINSALDNALKVIANTQCDDGGWDYVAEHKPRGHDLSLAVMQAKALRSAVDSGLQVPPEVIQLAIKSVREHYTPKGGHRNRPEAEQKKLPGQFTYSKGGGGTVDMAAAGVVCLQEFGQYDDWRIANSMDVVTAQIKKLKSPAKGGGEMPIRPYALYYVGQALYQAGGKDWQECYPRLRDFLAESQINNPKDPATHGMWKATGHVGSGRPGNLYSTSVACFILAMPNRYLPILQEGKIESLKRRYKID